MAIFIKMPEHVIRIVYTHRAWYGPVPVYVRLPDREIKRGDTFADLPIYERNGIPGGSIEVWRTFWKVLTIFAPSFPTLTIGERL